ncbi:MAG: HAD-IIIA family hydrolase [Pseudomonadota bacterium]
MKLVVLGRDGVVNQVADQSLGDGFQPVPGSVDAIVRLNQAGFRVVVATNQQKIARDNLSVGDLHDVHQAMVHAVQEKGGAIEAVFFAASGNPDGHGKRQPKVALLRQIERRYQVPCESMTVVGDSRADLEAAKSVGARALLVQTGRGQTSLNELSHFDGVTIYRDLAAASEALCRQEANRY